MTHLTRTELDKAVADALRGHRPSEYEGVAVRLATAAKNYIDHVEAERSVAPKGLADMQREVTEWCERKGWKGEGSAPVTFGDTMALLHSEVSEALEAYRDWGLDDATGAHSPGQHNTPCSWAEHALAQGNKARPEPPCDCGFAEGRKPEGVGSEFADILIRLLDDCDRWGVDLQAEFDRKMAYNETRAYQHGGRIL